MPSKFIASIFALTAFMVALLSGMAAGNTPSEVVWRSMAAMLICYPVGLALGAAGSKIAQDYVDAYKRKHPIQPADEVIPEEIVDELDLGEAQEQPVAAQETRPRQAENAPGATQALQGRKNNSPAPARV